MSITVKAKMKTSKIFMMGYFNAVYQITPGYMSPLA